MATDMYLTVETITGESQRVGHEGEIDVLAWSFGGSNPSSIGVTGSGSGAGKVTLQDFSLTKYLDAATAELFQAMCDGRHFPTAKLTVYKAGGTSGPLPYLIFDFIDLFPTTQSVGGSGGEDTLTENVTFAYGKVTVTYSEQGTEGTGQGDHVGSWNVRSGAAT
jgi:type VI secretion system secreted protein Hcp